MKNTPLLRQRRQGAFGLALPMLALIFNKLSHILILWVGSVNAGISCQLKIRKVSVVFFNDVSLPAYYIPMEIGIQTVRSRYWMPYIYFIKYPGTFVGMGIKYSKETLETSN
jgi:hypothetical protein